MERKIELATRMNEMSLAYEKVIIGFSGGADSSALLHYFAKRARKAVCVHVNHMIRGDEAQRDEDFCKGVCEKYGIELVCYKIDIPALARQRGQGIEETARQERYRVFEKECECRGFDAILTAHNANDNIESVIFNLVRGSGANGIAGIKAKNGRILRPLLLATREEILAYCEKNGIDYVTDSTNSDTDYTRNYIRHEVVPSLKKINPSLNESISRLIASLREDEEFITSVAMEIVKECKDGKIYIDKISSCHNSVKSRVLKMLCSEKLDYTSIQTCIDFISRGEVGGAVNLCNGVSFKREKDYFSFVKTKDLEEIEFEIELRVGLNEIEKAGIVISYMCDEEPSGKELYATLCFKGDKINGKLIARSRQNGDTIKHGKMTKRVKKLMNEKGIPSHLRSRIPIICDESGILAIPEVAIKDGVKGEDVIIRLWRNIK